jgi:hypothetical protein
LDRENKFAIFLELYLEYLEYFLMVMLKEVSKKYKKEEKC